MLKIIESRYRIQIPSKNAKITNVWDTVETLSTEHCAHLCAYENAMTHARARVIDTRKHITNAQFARYATHNMLRVRRVA